MSNLGESLGRVGVFMGGISEEREISLKSGKAVFEALKLKECDVHCFDITSLEFDYIQSIIEQNSLDIIFIALHGTGGEDGHIQKVLTELNVPFTGSDEKASFIAYDKIASKKVFNQFQILTPEYWEINSKNFTDENLDKISFPVFLKPPCQGSSVDVYRCKDKAELKEKLKVLLKNYEVLLVEKEIKGREITAGILGAEALPVIELRPKQGFYDFKAKYTQGETEYLVPAPLSPEVSDQVQNVALLVHESLGLSDFSRVDFILDSDNQAFVLEVNTIPGFTDLSLLPKAAGLVGYDFGSLCIKILRLVTAVKSS